jgi:hypothetical protein
MARIPKILVENRKAQILPCRAASLEMPKTFGCEPFRALALLLAEC